MASGWLTASGRLPLASLGLAMLLGCGGADIMTPSTGVIAVTVATSGDEADPDGYTLSLDDLSGTSIGLAESRELTVTAGNHTLELSGLADNCAVQGDGGPRRSVSVSGGSTVPVEFDVVCGSTTGALTVTTATTGSALDPDGYTVTVDQGSPQPIAPSGTLTVPNLAPGNHTVGLSGVAANCAVGGDNPAAVAVAAGATATVAFAIDCAGAVARWTPVDAGTRADLTEVWGTSASDVFIVGEMGSSRISSVVRHFDGNTWTEQARVAELRLRGLWGSAPTDVYAVGFDMFAPIARMLHYDGSAWTELPPFAADAEDLSFEAVWGTAAQDVWAVGSAFDGAFDHALIYHFDGTFWQRMLVQGQNVNPGLVDVWGTGTADVWAAGREETSDPSTGVVLHYDGTSWTPVLEQSGFAPNAIWGSSPTDVFVAGFQVTEDDEGNFTVTSAIWHFDGTAWAPMSVPSGDTVLNDIWGTSASNVFAAGDDGLILHFDGTAWTGGPQTDRTLLGVWASSPDNAYAVGLGGRVIHGTP